MPMHKSTPIKIKSNNSAEDENFDEVSALLMNAASSYDTLKLFKPKPKNISDESRGNEKVKLLFVKMKIFSCIFQFSTVNVLFIILNQKKFTARVQLIF